MVHLVGDYVLQSDWMATRKRTEDIAALAHAFVYTVPFMFFHPSPLAVFVIMFTHYLIDRFGLARYVVWAKNFIAPRWMSVPFDRCGTMERNRPWADCVATGYPSDRPLFLAVWLLIIADNVLHIVINGAALRWL